MPRGIPWDDLPRSYKSKVNLEVKNNPDDKNVDYSKEDKNRDYYKDIEDVARRMAFGMTCGSITGATFGVIDIVRDVKEINSKKSLALGKIVRYSCLFGGFFGAYHGFRKIIKLFYYPVSAEENLVAAGVLCVTPMIFVRSFRPMIPYGVMLIALDAVNGLYDI